MKQRNNTLPYLTEKYREDTTQYTFQGLPIDGLSAPELRAILAYMIYSRDSRTADYREIREFLSKRWGTA